jgi:hypothetical protein
MSFPPGTEMFQFPGFAPPPYRFGRRYPIAGVGCPIRRSPDRSPLAAPRGLSQRATSFVASWRQGIHQVPFLSLDPAQRRPHCCPASRAHGPEDGKSAATPGGARATTHTPRAHLTARPCSTAERRLSIPMPKPAAPEDGKTEKKRARQDTLASARPRAASREASRAQRTGTNSLTTTRCAKNGRHGPAPAAAGLTAGDEDGFPCGNRPPGGDLSVVSEEGTCRRRRGLFPLCAQSTRACAQRLP